MNEPTLDVIGRYRMVDKPGHKPAEIIFAKISFDDGTIEFASWERTIEDQTRYRGIYQLNFRAALHDFIERVAKDSEHYK